MRRTIAAIAVVLAGCGGAASPGTTTPEQAAPRECTAALRFEEPRGAGSPRAAQASDDDLPRTTIRLVLICEDEPIRTVDVGTEVGACFGDEAGDGSLLRARCWWAGQGAIVVVRRNGEVLEVLRADVDEQVGTGELEPVTQLEIPANHTLDAL